jgi:hypothetical protein
MESKFTKSTDSEHKVKLESKLLYAIWRASSAPAGTEVGVEVATEFVGVGAPIKINGKSEGGKKLGKISGKVNNNVFAGVLTIPEDIEIDDEVYFEVKLSKNGIDGESNRIPVVPTIVVTNMKWSAAEARRGDVLKLTADVSGCQDGTEATVIIYEYDRDNVHDKIVEIPAVIADDKLELEWEYEYHEDTDEVPTEEELQEYGSSYNPPEYFFVIDINGQRFGEEQESGILEFKDYIERQMVDDGGAPLANANYVVVLADGTEQEGTLDEDGWLRLDDVPPGRYQLIVSEALDDDEEEQDEGDDDTQRDDEDEQESTQAGT